MSGKTHLIVIKGKRERKKNLREVATVNTNLKIRILAF